MRRSPVLVLENLAVHAGGRPILEIDRLAVEPGQAVAVLGPNGAGKSTLLRTCALLQRWVRGTLSIFSTAFPRCPGFAAAMPIRRRIGYLPQLHPATGELPLTVREVLAIGRTGVRGLLRPLNRQDHQLVQHWLERLNLQELADRPYANLSAGQQRRVLLGRLMVQEPEILLLDEPTANLDLSWRRDFLALLDELVRQSSCTLLLACHELESIPSTCSRVVFLNQGRILADGLPSEVLSSPAVQSALFTDNLTVRPVDCSMRSFQGV